MTVAALLDLVRLAPIGSVWQSQLRAERIYTVIGHRPERKHRSGRMLEPDALCRRYHDQREVFLPARSFSVTADLRPIGNTTDGWTPQ